MDILQIRKNSSFNNGFTKVINSKKNKQQGGDNKKINIKINKNFDLIPLNKNYTIGNYYIYFGDNNHQIIKLKNIEVNNGNFIKKCIGENNEIIYPNKKNFFPFFFSPFKVLYEDKLGIYLMDYLNEYPYAGYYLGFKETNKVVNYNNHPKSFIVEASKWNKQFLNSKILKNIIGVKSKMKNTFLSMKIYKDGNYDNLNYYINKVNQWLEQQRNNGEISYSYYKVRQFVRKNLLKHKVNKTNINIKKTMSDSEDSNSDLEWYEQPDMKRYFYYHSRLNKMGQVSGWSKMDNDFERSLKDEELQTSIPNFEKNKRRKCITRQCKKKTTNEYGVCKKCYEYYLKNVSKNNLTSMQNIIKKYKNYIIQKDIQHLVPICSKCNYNLDFNNYCILNNIVYNNDIMNIGDVKFDTFNAEWICPKNMGGCNNQNTSKNIINNDNYVHIKCHLEDNKNEKFEENVKKYNETTYNLVCNYIVEHVNN